MSTHHGYFAIADISGYTGYLASNELEHARGVLGEITDLLIREMRAPFQFVELEGDAVFVFASAESVSDAEHLVEIIEACYASFRLLQQQMVSNTSCTCAACRAIKDLDLKCVMHYGEYAPQSSPTGTKLLGPDIILIHRLLKNHIIEQTGVQAYAFLTNAVGERAKVANFAAIAMSHRETYDELGMVEGFVIDLSEAASQRIGNKRYYVAADDADFAISSLLPASKSVVWPYFIDPSLRLKWQHDTRSVENQPGEHGRTGAGTSSYCDHGNYRLNHRFVDWRPFDYMTSDTASVGRSLAAPPPCFVTFELEEVEPNVTKAHMRIRLHNRSWWMQLVVALIRPLMLKTWRGHLSALKTTLSQDQARIGDILEPVGDGV